MKKRIVSMILALSMVLSILPVSAFADAGTSAAAAETTAAGTNEETTNPVVTIEIGADGLPEKQSGTGWSCSESGRSLTITGVENAKTEYILSGEYNWNVAITNSGNEVYLLDGVVKGQLWVGNRNACVLGGSYAEAVLENGTIDGGTYGKLTENGGSVTGGYFKDISGLKSATQQQAHKLILQDDCTLNGQPVTGDVYMLKRHSDHSLKLEVQYARSCVAWAAAIGGMSDIRSLPVGISNVSLNGYATVSTDGTTISAEVSMFPPLSESNAPIALTPIPPTDKELSFTGEGVPDVNGVPRVYNLDEDRSKVCVYFGKGWTYTCCPNIASMTGELELGDQGGKEIDFSQLSAVPINCAVELSNATVTGGIIRQADFEDVTIKDSTFDYLSCMGKCTISNVVAQSFSFDRSGDLAISDTVLCKLSGNGIENALADGQRLSKLTVRNGGVTAINGRDLPSFKDSQLDLALYLSATKTNHDLEAALHLMQNYDPSMLCGLVQLLTSQEAKDTAKAELKYQVENSQDIADVRALKDSLSKIQLFVSSVGQYTAGVQTAADGAHSAKDGSAQLAAGTKTLYDGVNTLNEGASQLNDGTHQLNDGLNQFNEEGISKLTGALDQDQLHGLKTVLDEMSDRLESYTSFAGAPEDAESSVKFVYKTAETVAAADNVVAETETVKEGNIFTRLWQRIVDLFKF